MKKLFSAIAVSLTFASSYSQTGSGYSYDVINTQELRKQFGPITTDPSGNIIITGQFETTITFGSFTLTNNNPSPGSYNTVFVAKKSTGGSFSWAKMLTPLSIPNGVSYIHVNGVCADASGNVYLTGDFIGKINIGSNIIITSTKSGSDYTNDIFGIKMSSNGSAVWGVSFGTPNDGCNASESGRSIATDNAGNVFITGQVVNQVFKNTTVCREINFPPCSNATTKSITCPIVLKYNSAGQKMFEKRFLSTSAVAGTSCWYNHPQGVDVRTDGSNVYVTGYFYGTVDFGNGVLSTGTESTTNVFLAKLSGTGMTQWARSITGAVNAGYIVGEGLFVDDGGNNIYFRGITYAGNTITSGGCSLTSSVTTGYLAKFSSTGSCSWLVPVNGISYGTMPHPNGNLAMLLRKIFYGIKQLSTADGSAIDSTEIPLADTATGGAGGYPSFARLPDGFVFSQTMRGTIHFADLTINSVSSQDFVLIKYTAPPPPIASRGSIISETSLNKLILYPNPTNDQINIRNSNDKILGTVNIYDVNGRMVYRKFIGNSQTVINVKSLANGFYYLKSDQLQATIKFVKQ